ncbi:HAMP domain-containing protein [Cohnella sp. CFH 77786]|uniref:cache domain-containing sensor histidine kinase n=1 Tax=Cohnella sp. CFH 77786 TaxID=2662265 RepID=UPI001C60C445|nr:sensor histidine kinase [Cohnella sp. CFH 77786]MBW5446495.1 HAMP domain-containing protein [Cohnella sp. CFH 77786]
MKSIHSRLLLLLAMFIIVPYFISVVLIYWQTKANVEKFELKNSREQLQKTSEDLEQYFQDMVDLPLILYRNPDLFRVFERGFEDSIYSNQLEIDKGMKTFYLMRQEIRQVGVYIAKGGDSFSVYDAMVSARKQIPDILDKPSIEALLNSKNAYWIEPPHQIENYNRVPNMPQSDRTIVLTFQHKIVDVLNNRFLGLVSVDIDLDRIAQICNRFIKGKVESIWLSDADGNVIYSSDPDWTGKPVDSNQKFKDGKGTGDIQFSEKLTGILNGWSLVKTTSSEYLFREVRKTAYTNIAVGIGVVILGLFMINIISYKIARPIKLLSRKVGKIEGENLHIQLNGTREDEIGHLETHIQDMMRRINLHIEREYRLELENKTNQFRALKSQINPHFLNNALQSIGAVAIRSGSPEVYKLVTSLSKMMRYAIRPDHWASVRSEVDYVESYLNFQKERFRTTLDCKIDIEGSLMEVPVPAMILQPLAENYFKHCFEEGWQETGLRIRGKRVGEKMVIEVENDGPGLTASELEELRGKIYNPEYDGWSSHDHIGLKNIHERLVLNYGSNAGLEVYSPGGRGFKVCLVIPQITKEGEENENLARG